MSGLLTVATGLLTPVSGLLMVASGLLVQVWVGVAFSWQKGHFFSAFPYTHIRARMRIIAIRTF